MNAPPAGIARAAALFQRLGAASPAGPLLDRYPAPRPPLEIRLRASRIARLLGQEVPAVDIPRFLGPLGFTVVQADGPERGWTVTVPTFRVDVTREVDLLEEVGRHYGFDRLPVRFPALVAAPAPPDPSVTRDRLVRHALTSAGLSESMTFAFIERQAALPFCEPGIEPTAIANPLSETFAVLRPSLLPGLIDSCAHNRRRGRRDVQLFELGSRFTSRGEGRSVAFAWTGAATGLHWSSASRSVDFFDAKGSVELLCGVFGVRALDATPSRFEYLVRGRAADVRSGDALLGTVGQLLPRIAEARGLPANEDVYVAEIDTEALARVAAADDLRAESLPRYPSIVRDVSILVDEALPAASVRGTIRAAAPPTLASIAEFDRYQGKGVPEGRISLSLRLTFRDPERTLRDDEAQAAMERAAALGGWTPELRGDRAQGLHVFERRFAEAEAELQQVLRERPQLGHTYVRLAMLYATSGRAEQALEVIEQGHRADPLLSTLPGADLFIHLCRGAFAEAVREGQAGVELHPYVPLARVLYATALAMDGQWAEALEQHRIARAASPDLGWLRAVQGACLATGGQPGEARQAAEEMELLRATEYVDAYFMAMLYGALANLPRAFAELERAFEENSATLFLLNVDPRLHCLRPDPRFEQVLRRAFPKGTAL